MSIQEETIDEMSVVPMTVPDTTEHAPKFVSSSNIYVYRAFFGNYKGTLTYRLNWGVIKKTSHVFVSATEGIMGAAAYTVHNVDPQDGYVLVRLTVNWGSPIPVYLDYLVING
jgi:hypothetical protein